MKKVLVLMIALLTTGALHAQNRLVTNQYVRTKVTDKTYTQKTGTTIPNDNLSINTANAKSWLVLEERMLPPQVGRMPWENEIVPLITHLACHASNAQNAINPAMDVYTSCGTYLYSAFDVNLQTFTRERIAPTGTFWNSESATACSPAPVLQQSAAKGGADSVAGKLMAATLTGPLNRCGVWAYPVAPQVGQWIYTRGKFYIPQTGTYYVGLAGDNFFRLKIDSADFVRNDASPLNEESYKIWHIFPVTLTAGVHDLYFSVTNGGNEAIMGCEIYNNTSTQLANATAETDLNIIYSTRPLLTKQICPETTNPIGNISAVNYTNTVAYARVGGAAYDPLPYGVLKWHAGFANPWTMQLMFTAPVSKVRLHIFNNEKFAEERILNGETTVSIVKPAGATSTFRVEIHHLE